jgi:hypothetical protein
MVETAVVAGVAAAGKGGRRRAERARTRSACKGEQMASLARAALMRTTCRRVRGHVTIRQTTGGRIKRKEESGPNLAPAVRRPRSSRSDGCWYHNYSLRRCRCQCRQREYPRMRYQIRIVVDLPRSDSHCTERTDIKLKYLCALAKARGRVWRPRGPGRECDWRKWRTSICGRQPISPQVIDRGWGDEPWLRRSSDVLEAFDKRETWTEQHNTH